MKLIAHDRTLWLKIFIGVLIFGAGILVGLFATEYRERGIAYGFREKDSNYRFINPLLFLITPEEQALPQYQPLKKEVERYVAQATAEHMATDISIYFRNLETSQWVGVNTEKVYSPASLLKVVTLIAVLKEAETDPRFLLAHVTAREVDGEINEMYFPPSNRVQAGETYSVSELLDLLIIESDNTASFILSQMLGDEKMLAVFTDLDIPPITDDTHYTSWQYSRLFRTLYNGTYLSKADSEKALELLSRTSYTAGLVHGVPSGIVVAHKFGTKSTTSLQSPTGNELHDCGIIYRQESPYFLCVMTKGADFKKLEVVISDISRLVWEESVVM